MLYLTAFLMMLAGLLIYMMDPVPTDLRKDLDNRGGEAYVVGFLNQHQAAREYLKFSLGRVFPGGDVFAYNDPGTITRAAYVPEASVIALPGGVERDDSNPGRVYQLGVESFMPLGLGSERVTDTTQPNVGFLKYYAAGADHMKGSYNSALICLDSADNLVPCYRYSCELGGEAGATSVDGVFWNGCSDSAKIASMSFRDNVIPYVITYNAANNNGSLLYPAWWPDRKTSKVKRLELWRRAMTRRSHSTFNCGVLVKADAGWSWHYNLNGGYNRVSHENDTSGSTYCLDNGQRCMNVLPSGMEQFLMSALGVEDLSELFICMSKIGEDPYEQIAPSTYHFDGINLLALDPQNRTRTGSYQYHWYSVSNTGRAGYVEYDGGHDILGEGVDSSDRVNYYVALKGNTNTALVMPFNHRTDDFTLSFITDIPDANGNFLLVGPDNEYFKFGYDGSGKLLFHPNNTGFTVEIEGDVVSGRHAWTIMRKAGYMYLFVDGLRVDTGNMPGSGSTPVGPAVTFGGAGAKGKILDIRYYDRALSGKQLVDLFNIDARRYGVRKVRQDEVKNDVIEIDENL